MRFPKTFWIPLVVMAVMFAFLWLSWVHRGEKAAISIGVLGYNTLGKGLEVNVAITNTGHVTISYNPVSFGDVLLQIESPSGWRTLAVDSLSMSAWTPEWLRPGSNTVTTVSLPVDTLRWQVRYSVRAVNLRQQIMWKIPAGWRVRMLPLCKRMLPENEVAEQGVWSQIFECPFTLPKAAASGLVL